MSIFRNPLEVRSRYPMFSVGIKAVFACALVWYTFMVYYLLSTDPYQTTSDGMSVAMQVFGGSIMCLFGMSMSNAAADAIGPAFEGVFGDDAAEFITERLGLEN